MIARMMFVLGTSVALAGFLVGVADSSYRHYFLRYADDNDRLDIGMIQEVSIVNDETKSKRGRK